MTRSDHQVRLRCSMSSAFGVCSADHRLTERCIPSSIANDSVIDVSIQLAPGLPSVATEQLIEHAEGVMVMQVRLSCEIRLLHRVFPIPGSILKEHNGKYHMNYNSLRSSGTKVRIVIGTSEL